MTFLGCFAKGYHLYQIRSKAFCKYSINQKVYDSILTCLIASLTRCIKRKDLFVDILNEWIVFLFFYPFSISLSLSLSLSLSRSLSLKFQFLCIVLFILNSWFCLFCCCYWAVAPRTRPSSMSGRQTWKIRRNVHGKSNCKVDLLWKTWWKLSTFSVAPLKLGNDWKVETICINSFTGWLTVMQHWYST